LFHAAKDSENLRLKKLLDEQIEKNNSTATGSVDHPIHMSPKRKSPVSNSNSKRVQLNENASIPHSGLEEESQEVFVCGRPINSLLYKSI
jgi:hypothetical protein